MDAQSTDMGNHLGAIAWDKRLCLLVFIGAIDDFLMRQSGSGRPTLWNHHLIKGLQAALSKEPEDFGYFSRGWTVGLLKDHMSRKHGVEFSETSIRRKFHELDYVNKRPRYCLNPDPARYKKSEIRRWFRETLSRKAILFEDETDLLLFPPLRSTWMPRGSTRHVDLTGRNDKRVVWGTINVETGHRLFMESKTQRSSNFQDFLKMIRTHYCRWDVALILIEIEVIRQWRLKKWQTS